MNKKVNILTPILFLLITISGLAKAQTLQTSTIVYGNNNQMYQYPINLLQYGRSGSSSSYDASGFIILIILAIVIVTVAVIAVRRRNKKPNQPREIIVMLCPFCGAKNSPETKYCGKCGQAINPKNQPNT
ncbi:MAG: zinc ribbon domain-containing protein [Sulfurimonas sp.]|jgi:ribosomal protein L40E